MTRRFDAGFQETIDGITFRVVKGKKPVAGGPHPHGHEDMRLEWLTPTGWVPMSFRAPFMMCDFFFENEEVLFPPERGFKGGHKFWEYARHAKRHGWQRAWAGVVAEKNGVQSGNTGRGATSGFTASRQQPSLFGEAS